MSALHGGPAAAQAWAAGLRAGNGDLYAAHVRAAAELLIAHGGWLRRADFTRECLKRDRREAWIDWAAARAFVDRGARASTSEMAVLDLAVALGENRYRLSIMGTAHSRWIAQAVAAAVGVDLALPAPAPRHNHPVFIPGDGTCPAPCATVTGEGATS